tara:strand:+ start:717 stop:1610 length:894 start_codon:yes stop_codon:yes gene_type:complete
MAEPVSTAMAISAGLNFVGGFFNRRHRKKQKRKEEKFLQKKYDEYDLPLWNMGKDRLIAQRDEIIRGIELKQRNELKLAAFKDKNNLRNYQQQLKIRSYQIDQQNRLFNKSERLYGQSIMDATERKALQERETYQQMAFENEDNIIESIIKKGELSVKSQAGASSNKAMQSLIADGGRQHAILTESLLSGNNNTRMEYKQFLTKADANRMLRPEAPPEPLKPLATPVADYEMPRALQDFDFGPKPIKGIATTQVPSFASTLASAVGAGFSAYAASTAGTTSFEPPPQTPDYGGSYLV